MATEIAYHLLQSNCIQVGTAFIIQFAALLRLSELFSLTCNDILYTSDLRLQPYGQGTLRMLVENPKATLHIAQQQFVPFLCPAAITILMDLRSHTSLSLSVLHSLANAKYRTDFQSALTYFKLPTEKLSLHGARGGAASQAHRK